MNEKKNSKSILVKENIINKKNKNENKKYSNFIGIDLGVSFMTLPTLNERNKITSNELLDKTQLLPQNI